MCNKVKHTSKAHARIARRNMSEEAQLTTYRCPDCHYWHVKHIEQKIRRSDE